MCNSIFNINNYIAFLTLEKNVVCLISSETTADQTYIKDVWSRPVSDNKDRKV